MPLLMFGIVAPPISWIGQVIASHVASALLCLRGHAATSQDVQATVWAFDATALALAFAGGAAAFTCWRCLRAADGMPDKTAAASRLLFLAMWGMMASVWLFGAILFNTAVSMPVQACLG